MMHLQPLGGKLCVRRPGTAAGRCLAPAERARGAAQPDAPHPDALPERPLGPAIRRGLRGLCPACGQGPLMSGYLTVRTECPVCGEDFSHQRADDGPAYLTILIVGHLMAPLLLWAYAGFRPAPLTMIAIFATGTVALSLFLLPRMKGMMVAIQWSRRMHGFGTGEAAAD